MKVESIEIALVCIIVSIQFWVFSRTYIQIKLFEEVIPLISSLKISKIQINPIELSKLTPSEILLKIEQYKNLNYHISSENRTFKLDTDESSDSSHSDKYSSELEEINIIESSEKTNKIFDNILFSANNYLIRNKGAASDFNLIKDIVERNINAVEEDINLSIGIPLYLGLMGTMIGIVIGLFNIPDMNIKLDGNSQDLILNQGITLLIGGVKIAMIASFVGLLLTIINSGWIFKGSRTLVEAKKNEFYTFIQIELLPIINQGIASTLQSLQKNLFIFNDDFGKKLNALTYTVGSLSGIFEASKEAIKSQKELLDAIDKTKVAEMTRYNVKVLTQLDISVTQFEKFNSYLSNVNLFVENSHNIVDRTNELLKRTDNFKTIADNLEDKLNQSQQLLEFLSAHFSKLEEHKEFTSNAVADVGHAISETFKELKIHIQNSSENVKDFTIAEIDLLKNALAESKTNLSNLEHLATLNKDLALFKNNASSQGERFKQQLDELNTNMAKSIAVLEEIEQSSLSAKAKNVGASIKKLFTS